MDRDDGFTLIEVLLVTVIIAVLAGIVIPLLFSQREFAWEVAVKSDLANAAIAMESYNVDEGRYDSDALAGFMSSPDVTMTVVRESSTFCLEGRHVQMAGESWAWDKDAGGQQGRGSSC